MPDSILQLLQWLVPTGSLGMLLGWITSARLRSARTAKEVHDIYKQMYEDLHNQVIEIAHDNSQMRASLSRLEQAIARGATCRLWPHCPIRCELQRAQGEPELRQLLRQRPRAPADHDAPRHPARGDGIDDPPLTDPDDPP